MARSKDPLTAAITSILKPAVTPLGFHKLGSRTFARVRDSVLQWFDFQLSIWGHRKFTVNYAAITLYSPREFLVIQSGGRLLCDRGANRWWDSQTLDLADAAMREVIESLAAQCLPHFEQTSTTAGLVAALLEEHASFGRNNAHYLFDIACCHAYLNQLMEAQQGLTQAAAEYRAWYQANPLCTWCLPCIAHCERLLAALRTNQHEQVLAEWRADSIRNLKLGKIV